MTAYREKPFFERALASGMDTTVTKPMFKDQI